MFSVFLAAGIIAAYLSGSCVITAAAGLAAASPVFLLLKKTPWRIFILAGILLFYSAGAFEYFLSQEANASRFKGYTDRQVTLKGYVDSEPDIRETKIQYVIRTKRVASDKSAKESKGRVLLAVPKKDGTPLIGYGREIEVRGELKTPNGVRNPGGFDYRRYLARAGISATIYARPEDIAVGSTRKGNWLVEAGFKARDRIVRVIGKSLPAQQAGLLSGMLIGYREGLPKEVQQAFSDAGLTHIMAVSGANIAFIAAPLAFIFKRLRVRRRIANAVIIAVLVMFVFVTGFSPSVMRALVMAVAALAGQMLWRESDVLTNLSLAFTVLLAYNPYNLFDAGFQLSFTATSGIILFYKSIRNLLNFKLLPAFIADMAAVTLAAQIGVMPVTAWCFNKVSIISIFSNLVVLPVVELITVIGAVMAVVGQAGIIFSQLVGYVNCTLLSFVLYVTKLSADIPFGVLRVPTPPIFDVIFYYIAILFFLWYKPLYRIKPGIWAYAGVFSLVTAVMLVSALIPARLEVVFLDVGEGDSIFIRTPAGKTALIDGGGSTDKTGNGPDVGETVVIPFLLDTGINRLDLVIATHPHDDHIRGLIPVLRDFGAEGFLIPSSPAKSGFKELLDISADRRIKTYECKAGDRIRLDAQTRLDVLFPTGGLDITGETLNNSSIVLKLLYGDTSVLLMGDAGADVERHLLDSGADVRADVLKIAHHGSSSSTKRDFLEAVKPYAAVISVGRNNFGHPSPLVLEELESMGIRAFRTDRDGALTLLSDGKSISFRKTVEN